MAVKCKVLIVEDELITRQALKYILGKEEQYEIIGEAVNGVEAQKLIEQYEPNIVISDIMMPVMDGIELNKWLQVRYPSTYLVVLSSYSDFEYVKKSFQYGAFEYILKPQLEPEKLLHILERIRVELNLKACHVKEGYSEQKELLLQQVLSEDSTFVQQAFDEGNCLRIVGCAFGGLKDYKKSKKGIYHDTLAECLKTVLGDKLTECAITSEGVFLGVICTSAEKRDEWDTLKDIIVEELHKKMPGIKLACSKVIVNQQVFTGQVEVVKKLAKQQFFAQRDETIYHWMASSHECQVSFPQRTYREHIEKGCYEQAFTLLQSFCREDTLREVYSEEDFKKIIEHALYTLTYYGEQRGDKGRFSENKLVMFKTIQDATSLTDLVDFLEEVFDAYLVHVASECHTHADKVMEKVRAYIEAHYSDQLTLQEVAKRFHLSYSYLSMSFSQVNHIGFNEYLNTIRIEKAKLLLEEAGIPIAHIGEQVGYLDQSYFSKVFKKTVGQSPSEYRKNKLR